MKFTKTFKLVAGSLLCAFVALTAYAQFSPSVGSSVIQADGSRIYSKEGFVNGLPVSIGAATRKTITNFQFSVPGPRIVGGIGFYVRGSVISNTPIVLKFDTSPDGVTYTVNQPLSVSLTLSTNAGAALSNTQPQTVFGSLDATNLIGVRSLRLTYLTNATVDGTALTLSNITAMWYQP